MGAVIEYIRENRLIAIVRGIPFNLISDTAAALYRGGIRCMEITFDQTATDNGRETLKSIELCCHKMKGKMEIGAGSVLTVEQVRNAAAAGATYIISPNTSEAVIAETKRLGLVSLPGAFSPTEIELAYRLGADFVKVFPAAELGPSFIRAMRAPLSHIPLLAVGGISPENLGSFLEAGAVGAGIGGNMVNKAWISEYRFDKVEEIARQYCDILRGLTV